MEKQYIASIELGVLGKVEVVGKVEAQGYDDIPVETVAYVNARAILQQFFEDDLGCEIISIKIVQEK